MYKKSSSYRSPFLLYSLREEHNLGAKCGHFGTPRHIWTSTSIDGNFGREKHLELFILEEAILRRKKIQP